MRTMIRITVPVDAGNKSIQNGTLPQTIAETMERLKPEAAYFFTDAPAMNPPRTQLGTLAGNDIFIKDVQPARRIVLFCESDRPASRTASAIASRLIAPSYSAMICSHAMPSATISRTGSTMMRVPLKVGLPWQISGSVTTYSPSFRRFIDLSPCTELPLILLY